MKPTMNSPYSPANAKAQKLLNIHGFTGRTVLSGKELAISTQMVFRASLDQVWTGLLFYEDIRKKPPFLLRMILPIPLRTHGPVSKVGDKITCFYEEGILLKQLTRVERGRLYEFDVIEQSLSFGGGIRLAGGGYYLRELSDYQTEVTVVTRYQSPKSPRWLWGWLERIACHGFHRHLLNSIRKKIEQSSGKHG